MIASLIRFWEHFIFAICQQFVAIYYSFSTSKSSFCVPPSHSQISFQNKVQQESWKKLFPIKLLPITEEEKVWKRLLGLWRTPRNLSFKCERNNFWFCTTLPKGKGSKPKGKNRKVYTFVCSNKNVGTNLTKIPNWNKCFKYEAFAIWPAVYVQQIWAIRTPDTWVR